MSFDSVYKSLLNARRSDLYVCDVHRIDRHKCAALIAYADGVPTPKMDDLFAFIQHTFDGKVIPQVTTAKLHPEDNAVSVVLTANLATRPATDSSTMRRIAANLFAEDRTASLWSLVDSNGRKYLVRNSEEDIAAIVAEAQRRNLRNPSLSLASVKTAAPIIGVGDVVKFFNASNVLMSGTVASIAGDNVTIRVQPSDEEITVSRYAVAEVIQQAPDAQAKSKAQLEDFFARIYGDREMAQQLTTRDVNDAGVYSPYPTFNK